MLEVQNIKKIYRSRFGKNELEALKSINFTVEAGAIFLGKGDEEGGLWSKDKKEECQTSHEI